MPRVGNRQTIERGVYRDSGGFEVRVTVGGVTYTERHPLDADLKTLRRARAALKAKGQTETPPPTRGTLDADIPRYLRLIAALVSFSSRRAHLKAWSARLGAVPRHRILPADILEARAAWLEAGDVSPKTINHRVDTLRHLYHALDGPRAKTPCDDLTALHVPRTPIQRIDEAVILAVDQALQRREQGGPGRPFDGAKTRARFRVLVSTGRRPSELMRAEKSDVNLKERVWVVRDGKGGWSPGVYLNDDMLAAWKLFIEADAWGYYNTSSFVETLRHAGWPAGVRLYNARHSTWIQAVERGADMADVQMGAGHKSLATTRQHYTGVRHSRMQRLSELLDGRFSGFPVVPESAPAKNRKRAK